MSETRIGKIVLGILITLIVIVASSQVFADESFTDLTGTLNNTTTSNVTNNTTNSSINNTVNNTTSNVNNSVLTTNNTVNSSNNSALPNTGIDDTMPVTILVVVLGISAIYAYKKIQDYKNI